MEIKIRLLTNSKRWHKKGHPYYYHREDGPAIMWNSGIEDWWYYDKFYEFPRKMPLNLFLAYCKWEYNKNGN